MADMRAAWQAEFAGIRDALRPQLNRLEDFGGIGFGSRRAGTGKAAQVPRWGGLRLRTPAPRD
eukprot:9888041-Alexandrium_andersonii.AAC.1